jgi:ankyrin repeat protein/predicted TIM-barrel fold metal-dependent hydrolase
MKEIKQIYWLSTFTIVFLISFQSSAHTIPDPDLVKQIAKIKAIDNYCVMWPATTNQGTEEEPADLLGQPPFDLPVNLRFDNPHWIGAWRDLYGYKYNDMEREHLSLLFKHKQRIKREQGENYPTWILDKLGIETALGPWRELGLGLTPPRFYWVAGADSFVNPFPSDKKPAATLAEYTKNVVTPAIESFKQDGAVAIKFIEILYWRPLNFEKVSSMEAASVYEQLLGGKEVSINQRRKLQDYLFRYITQEAGRLDLKVHIYSGIGRDPHFNISGSNPMLLESVFNDPDQRNTKFVINHGGWPFEKQAGAMLIKPNVYVDFSGQAWFRSASSLSETIRAWLEWYPEKVLFGTKALGITPLSDWEERAWLSTKTGRNALAIALTEMMNDGQISRNRAVELAEMVLRTNALRLYDFKSTIHKAADAGDLAKVKAFIQEGVDVNTKVHGCTPLHCAARYGHKEVAELLIAKGADVNAKDTRGRTPIDLAINQDRKEMAKLLASKSGNVSLHTAAYIGDLQRVQKFIAEGANIDANDQKGQTALYYAAKAGQIEVAKLLIANGADVNAGEWTPLQEAAYHSKEMVELLIAKGADIDAGEWPALHCALDARRFDIVELLLAKGADANIKDEEGHTPLHIAVWYAASRYPKIVELLISNGADINAKNNNGKTALSYALENYQTEIVELLCKHGADDNKKPERTLKNIDLTNSDKPYVVLERGDVRAVIVNNEPVDDEVLPGHRGGYSGVASLTHRQREQNLFVPFYAGLNFEHIHDGTNQPRDILFEPRRAPMQIKQIDEYTAELYQPPTPHWQLESWLRYQLLEYGVIEMSLECIPRARTFKNDYIGLFFASYIDKPESLDIHFLGRPADQSKTKPGWIRGVTPEHGTLPTHLAIDDNRNFAHDPNFPLTLVFNKSNYRYTEPWYYGISSGMAFVLMFRPGDNVRFSQSPSGAGNGNPAWDFQWFVPQYQVGQRYRFVMRAMYLPFESQQQIIRATARHRAALEQQ